MDVWWLTRVIARYPYAILSAVFVISTICLVAPLVANKFPDFSDPQLGFEARGTTLAKRLVSWEKLMEESSPRGNLIDDPLEYNRYLQQTNRQTDSNSKNHTWTSQGILIKRLKNRKKGKKYGNQKSIIEKKIEEGEVNDKWEEVLKLRNKNRLDIEDEKDESNWSMDHFFCNLPTSAYARVVISSDSEDTNLWSMDGVLAQCHIDDVLRANLHFSDLCQMQVDRRGTEQRCCRSWSPANYVALLSNRSSCLGVTDSDLAKVEILLQRCSYYYRNLQLTADCTENLNCQTHVPMECYAHNAPYHLLHYLLDADFVSVNKDNSTNKPILRSAMLFLPIAASSASFDFYKDLKEINLSYGKFSVHGMNLGLKSTLFDRLLVSDSVLLLSGFTFVTLCIWAYTNSLLLTVATILAVLFSLGISYTLYTVVLRIKFFPFMNLLAIVVAVGIGADDVFIYCKVWEDGKQRKPSETEFIRLVQQTMVHAIPSMFVTSLTTAAAFFASIVSNVTAINCFSLFSGMTVIANFFLMVTWLPACVVVSEHCRLTALSPANYIARKIIRPLKMFGIKMSSTFTNFLTRVTIGFRWLWLVGLGAAALGSCVVVFRYPGLRLPDSPEFQLFDSSHPFEQYDLVYSRKFWFERFETGDQGEVLPLRFVWGVKPVDNGNYLDPAAKGTIEWDNNFDVSDPNSQIWLRQFCRNLRVQPFYRSTLGPLLPNCFIESLYSWMQRGCLDPVDSNIDRTPCCESSKFPYTPTVLRQCAAEASTELYRTPSYLWTRNGVVSGGLKFFKEKMYHSSAVISSNSTAPFIQSPIVPQIKALIVEYDSTYAYTLSFAKMDEFYLEVDRWMQEQLLSAPIGMRGGWFVSKLDFYELQRTLYEGTIWAMGVSMGLSLTVLIFVTLNPLVSLYAIIAIGAAIIVTVAVLILLGWKLNVLESVAVSTAIGLAVDFSLHYGVSYRTSDSRERKERAKRALEQMGGPTLMATLTSGAAGAFMLPSRVLAYIQIGIFLLVVMGVSWIYATLFFCPLLAVLGPSSQFAQFKFSRIRTMLSSVRKNNETDAAENDQNDDRIRRRSKNRGMLSESTLSTSSTICQFHSNELKSLATRTQLSPPPSLPPSPTLRIANSREKHRLLFCFRKNGRKTTRDITLSNKKNKRNAKGRNLRSESTLSTSSTVCQFHNSEVEALASHPPRSPSLSPSSTLLRTSHRT